jgi:KUP system potassium uptake protein
MQSIHKDKTFLALVLGAIGVVFGDIGTSPLYAFRECFVGHHALTIAPENIFGVLSLMLWSLILVVSIKYLGCVMRADNQGEGGVLALMALALKTKEKNPKAYHYISIIGMIGAATFYADSMITPAISVLSAVEGLQIATPKAAYTIIPLTLTILTGLFWVQKRGTARIGAWFGPIITLWFIVIGLLGLLQIIQNPGILAAFHPKYAFQFALLHQWYTFFTLGAVVLVITGAEALYADMGHFGISPIRFAWFLLAMPALFLNYLGQGALLLYHPETLQNPFFYLAPAWGMLPLVILATLASIIASQAVITGTFSMTRQAIQLGYSPLMVIHHTSYAQKGQIYLPFVNWILFLSTVFLVLFFRHSTHLAAAYGLAVTITMLATTLLAYAVMRQLWRWSGWLMSIGIAVLLAVDIIFVSASSLKIVQGGFIPLLIGLAMFLLMNTWHKGRDWLLRSVHHDSLFIHTFIQNLQNHPIHRVPGVSFFFTSSLEFIPRALLHNLKHNSVLHEEVVFLTINTLEAPVVKLADRLKITLLGSGFYQVIAFYGFKETPDMEDLLTLLKEKTPITLNTMNTSFFVSREIIATDEFSHMKLWQGILFAWMKRNALSATEFFNIPLNRVIELGVQVKL